VRNGRALKLVAGYRRASRACRAQAVTVGLPAVIARRRRVLHRDHGIWRQAREQTRGGNGRDGRTKRAAWVGVSTPPQGCDTLR
jgi:hypothetical protein